MATATPNPLTQIGDDVRPMTDAEYSAWSECLSAQQQTLDELAEKAAAAASGRAKLAALGLTDDEINALLGA